MNEINNELVKTKSINKDQSEFLFRIGLKPVKNNHDITKI